MVSKQKSLKLDQALILQQIESDIKKWKEELEQFKCPISLNIMKDPVLLIETGHTYDRESIEQWFQTNNTCPLTGKKLIDKKLVSVFYLKKIIDEGIKNFILKIKENIKIWLNEESLLNVCEELVEEVLTIVKDRKLLLENSNMDLIDLQFDILITKFKVKKMSQLDLMKSCQELIKKIKDPLQSITKLKDIEQYITEYEPSCIFYELIINLVILNIKLTKTIMDNEILIYFERYSKKGYYYMNIDFIKNCLQHLQLDKRIYLFKLIMDMPFLTNQNLLLLLIDFDFEITIQYKSIFIQIIKKVSNEFNFLHEYNILKLLTKIENIKELNKESCELNMKLFNDTGDVYYLEKAYLFDNTNIEIINILLEYYKNKNMFDKLLNLYIKTKHVELDPTLKLLIEIQSLQYKLLQKKDEENKKLFSEMENKFIEMENKYTKHLQHLNNQLLLTQHLLFNNSQQQILTNYKKLNSQFKQISSLLNDEESILNLITIQTPIDVKKEDHFYSNPFEVFGLKWRVCFFPKGGKRSKENECAIFLHLIEMKQNDFDIESVAIKRFISNENLDENSTKEFDCEYKDMEGYGSYSFLQKYYSPIRISKDKQEFKIMIGIKLLHVQF
ncbi:hypothetical protein ABK040_004424 [Willaertia magna]